MKLVHGRRRSGIARALLAALLVASFAGAAQAQTTGAKAPDAKVHHITELRGQWSLNGPAFVCTVGTKEKLKPSADMAEMLARACQHMGPFVVGDDAQVLKQTLGEPHRTMPPQPNGAVSWLYFLEQQEHYPYFVATVLKDRIIALQVTGPVAAKGYDFNHVDLGVTT